jgi:hypothetical protein
MTAKDQPMQVIKRLPDNATLADILHALSEEHERDEALRRFDQRGGAFDEDLTEEEWITFVAHCWADNLNEAREDIYTDEDGDPVENS